jgi:hypothetical protein
VRSSLGTRIAFPVSAQRRISSAQLSYYYLVTMMCHFESCYLLTPHRLTRSLTACKIGLKTTLGHAGLRPLPGHNGVTRPFSRPTFVQVLEPAIWLSPASDAALGLVPYRAVN